MNSEISSGIGRRSAGPPARRSAVARGRRFGSRQLRALLSLGLVLGLGSIGTLAYWTDTATMRTGQFSSGTLDIRLNGNLAGQGGTWTNPAAASTALLPGDSFAFAVPVERPAGTVGYNYRVTGAASGTLASSLRWSAYPGGTASNSAADASVRTGSCTGSASFSDHLVPGPKEMVPSRGTLLTPRTTTSTMSENVCFVVSLPSTVGNGAQGLSATATFVFEATQQVN